MKKLTTILAILMLGSFLVVGNAFALPWVLTGDAAGAAGTSTYSETNIVAVTSIGDPENATQSQAIYGAGFTQNLNGIYFDVDLATWDSYADPNISGNTGWWDAFIVNINQTDFLWNLGYSDPVVSSGYAGGTPVTTVASDGAWALPGASWVWGGQQWGDGVLDTLSTTVIPQYFLEMTGGDDSLPYYVSLVLDTKTLPTQDNNYVSWGTFQVTPVPEPATMLLFGAGLFGLAAIGRKKFAK